MRHAGDIGVQGNAHHSGILRAFDIQLIELSLPPVQELTCGMTLQGMHNDVVGLDCVGDCGDHAMGRLDVLRQIVNHPISHVIHPMFAQEIERVFGFRQTGTFPAARAGA